MRAPKDANFTVNEYWRLFGAARQWVTAVEQAL